MATEAISPELILEILNYVDRSDLWSFYTCSRRLYTITQPLIYSTFTQTGQHALPNLLCSIIAKPHLATCIKHLDLSILGRRHNISDIDTSFLSETDLTWIRAQLLNAGWSKEWVEDWVTRLSEKDNWDAAAGLLMCLCSKNLESIVLRGGRNAETQTIRSTLEFAADEKNYFPKLRYISLLSKPAKKFGQERIPLQRTSPELLSSASKLTEKEELHIEGLFNNKPNDNIAKALLQSYSPITAKKMSFEKCQLDARVLGSFLQRFNALTHFKYEAECYHISGTHLVNTDIKTALRNSRHTLTHLSLDPGDEWYDMGPGGDTNDPVLGDMRAFTKLRYLEVDALMLLGPEMETPMGPIGSDYYMRAQCGIFVNGFPESLEMLVIQRCYYAILEPVTQLLKAGVQAKLSNIVGGQVWFENRGRANVIRSWVWQIGKSLDRPGMSVWLWRRRKVWR
jgi:hypothetical protein